MDRQDVQRVPAVALVFAGKLKLARFRGFGEIWTIHQKTEALRGPPRP